MKFLPIVPALLLISLVPVAKAQGFMEELRFPTAPSYYQCRNLSYEYRKKCKDLVDKDLAHKEAEHLEKMRLKYCPGYDPSAP